ncbi:MAG TPA: XRE family transcriptional regulator [Gaiellales bacterium]|jgi:transcriptional regulator with XRE-family HTH domain|nr:XRE family transcriptional regulator [Gaiellales bacterium]
MDEASTGVTPSTGLGDLDQALHGLYWGDNVVWEPDRAETAAPFYGAIAALAGQYDYAAYVSLSRAPEAIQAAYTGLAVIDARPGTDLVEPGPLLNAIRRQAAQRGRTLLLFDPLDDMAERWGADMTRRFFTRCCPLLLQVGAIAYWSLSHGEHFEALRRDVEDVTQCVLVVRDGRLRIAKAEGRPVGVQGSVYHYRATGGRPRLVEAPAAARLGAALRAVRMQRQLSQAQLAQLAEVSPSAISQAERGQRGLSLETLLTLTARLNITIDELLRGRVSPGYRLGRRDDPTAPPTGTPVPLLDDPEVGLRAYLVRLAPAASATPNVAHKGTELVAVIAGLVQVHLTTGRPVLRQGEALLADRTSIRGWRNLSQRPSQLFWIIRD